MKSILRKQRLASLKTITKVGQAYSLSSNNTVARYLRINYLIEAMKSQMDNGNIAFVPAVTLSYLNESEQALLADCIEQFKFPVDMKKADMLRKYSEKRRLDVDSIKLICQHFSGQFFAEHLIIFAAIFIIFGL